MAINFILSKFFSQFTKASCPCKLFYQYFYEWYFFSDPNGSKGNKFDSKPI